MKVVIFTLIVFVVSVAATFSDWSNLQIYPNKENQSDLVIQCTKNAVNQFFDVNSTILILLPVYGSFLSGSVASQLHGEILKAGNFTSFTMKPLAPHYSVEVSVNKPDYVIMFCETITEMDITVSAYIKSNFWTPNSKLLIVTQQQQYELDSFLQSSLKELWTISLKAVVIQLFDRRTNMTKFWSLLKQYPDDCVIPSFELKNLGKCFDKPQWDATDLIPYETILNMKGCKLRVGAVTYPPFVTKTKAGTLSGIEVELVSLVGELINYSTQYRVMELGENYGEINYKQLRNSSGIVGLLVREQLDCMIGGLLPDVNRSNVINTSITYGQDAILGIVPKRVWRKTYVSLFVSIRKEIWLLFAGAICITVLAYLLFSMIGGSRVGNHTLFRRIIELFFDIYNISIERSVVRMPRCNFLRFVLLLWLFHAVIWTTTVKSELTTILTVPFYQTQIKTTDELIRNDYKIGVPGSIFDWIDIGLKRVHSARMKEIFKRFEKCGTTAQCLGKVANTNGFSTLAREKSFVHLKDHYTDVSGYQVIGKLPKRIVIVPIEILFRKKFPVLKTFNHWVRRLIECGFLQKMETMSKYFSFKRHMYARKRARNLETGLRLAPVQMQSFKVVVLAFILLNILCTLILLAEKMWCRIQNR